MTAFKKLLAFTDIHFGRHNNSSEHNQKCVSFIEWAISVAKDENCDSIAFLGDWSDHRTIIGVDTLNYSERGLSLLSESGLKIYFLIGNHDLFYKENRSTNSLPFIERYNITFVDDPLTIGDTVFLPWLNKGETLEGVVLPETKYVFGHLELPGFIVNGGFEMPERKDHLRTDDIVGPEYIFSGHFHARQIKKIKNTWVHYIGNVFPFDFSDAGDTERGVMILEHGGTPQYRSWPDAPSYHYVTMDDIEKGDFDHITERSTIKIQPGDNLRDDEREELEEFFRENLNVTKVSTDPRRNRPSTVEFDGSDIQNTPTLLVNWIKNAEDIPSHIDREYLVELIMDLL